MPPGIHKLLVKFLFFLAHFFTCSSATEGMFSDIFPALKMFLTIEVQTQVVRRARGPRFQPQVEGTGCMTWAELFSLSRRQIPHLGQRGSV